MNKFLCFIFLYLIIGLNTFGQDDEKERIVEQRIEFIGENLEDSNIDFTTFFDDLYFYYDNPLNLNEATFYDFQQLHLLSELQIQSILNYKRKYGNFLTIYELAAIEELDFSTIEMIIPFLNIGQVKGGNFEWRNAIKYGNHEIISRYQRVLQIKEGYITKPDSILADNPNKQYLGSPDKFYLRYRNRYKNRLSFGVTMEKDAGEEFFRGTQKQGFDFYSAHVYATKLWKFEKIAVGDYQVNFGQGLTMWSSFALGKSADVMSSMRSASGIRPYTSVNETQFLRGGAFSLSNEKVEFTAFSSYKSIDANIAPSDTVNDFFDNRFTSLQVSGFHRTPRELEDKNTVQELVAGGELAYKGSNFRIGLAGVYTQYDQAFQLASSAYQHYNFSGNQLFTGGLNYKLYHKKIVFFGESAISDNFKLGTVNGVTWNVDSRLSILLLQRFYDKGFQSIYSAGFGETSNNAAENGIYVGAEMNIMKWLKLSAFFDQYQKTYLSWLTYDYSDGRDFFVQADFKINRKNRFYVRYRNDRTERNAKGNHEGVKNQVDVIKNQFRVHFDHDISSQIRLKSRIEYSNVQFGDAGSNGVLLFQDIRYKFEAVPLNLYARYAIFDTDNYDTRVYAYENDLLYVFSVPSYYYRGIRTYLMAKLELNSKIDIWLRYGLWSYSNVDSISSGLEEINGKVKSDVKVQIRIKL